MIPNPEARERPPLTFEFAMLWATLTPVIYVVAGVGLLPILQRLPMAHHGMTTLATFALVFAICAARFRRAPALELALIRPLPSAWLAVALVVPAALLSSEIDNWVKLLAPLPASALLEPPAADPRFQGAALALVFLAVLPLAYELFFRGIFQPLAVARFGALGGIALTALLSAWSAIWVVSARGVLPVVAQALVLGALRHMTGSLWPSLALHVLWGALTLGASFEVFGIPGFDLVDAAHTPAPYLIAAAVSTALGLSLAARAQKPQS